MSPDHEHVRTCTHVYLVSNHSWINLRQNRAFLQRGAQTSSRIDGRQVEYCESVRVCVCACVRACVCVRARVCIFVCGVCLGMYATTHTHTETSLAAVKCISIKIYLWVTILLIDTHSCNCFHLLLVFCHPLTPYYAKFKRNSHVSCRTSAHTFWTSGNAQFHFLRTHNTHDVSDESHRIGQRIEYCVSSLQACGSGNGRHDDQPQSG
jgi:hypothetical protein